MGLFGKHKGKAKAPFTFGVLVHTLAPFPAGLGPVCVTYERGSHSGATQPSSPSRGSAAYVFEQQLVVPATLYQRQDAKRSGRRAATAYERKELTLAVVAADARGRPAGAPLGTVVLNLADYAAVEGRSMQQAFTVAPAGGRNLGGAKLLLTIRCQEGRASGGGGLAVDRSLSSLESAAAAEALAAADEGELPTTLSSDDEGSRPSSRATSSRPGSRADAAPGPRDGGALASVPEEAAAAAGKPVLGSWRQAVATTAAATAAAASSNEPGQAAAEASGLHDDDGFLIDSSVDASLEQEAEASASVRRNLGSALDRAEASEASRPAEAEAASRPRAAPEVQSQLSSSSSMPRQSSASGVARLGSSSSFPRAAVGRPDAAAPGPSPFLPAAEAAAAAGDARNLERAASGARLQGPPPVSVLAPGPEGESGELQSPDAVSAGQLSSLSAAGDPAIPFSVPPSTHRRFARHGEEGAAGGRRWAWRREGGRPGSGGTGGSMFQRARIASVNRQESSEGVPGRAAVEASACSAASSSAPSVDLSSRRTTSEDPAGPAALPAGSAVRQGPSPVALPLEQQLSEGPSTAGASAAAAAAANSAFAAGSGGTHPGSAERGPHNLQRPSADAAAAALAAAQRQRSLMAGSGMLRPAISLLDSFALPSPVDQPSPSPYGNNPLADALVRELRTLAALESAVYLAGGRRAFAGATSSAAGASRQLHAPARRLARTILSLGPQEGLAFGLQAIRAIEATAGAASGDLHRLTFWWSNILQLRLMLWALGQGPDAAVAAAAAAEGGSGGAWPQAAAAAPSSSAGSRLDELDQQASGAHWSPRAVLAAAAGTKHGLDWMQLLLAPLRELEGWLFSEMLKHLWWRVLLQEVTALQPGGSSSSLAKASPLASSTAALRPGEASNGAIGRSAQSAPHLAAGVVRGSSDGQGTASMQGTPRSFETPEEEAVQRWVVALGGVERSLRGQHRPPPAPRPHLALLHRHLIVALLHRLDTLLFRKLLLDEGEVPVLRLPSMSGRDTFSRSAEADEVLGSAGAEAAAVGLLEPAVLPFQRGAVTFGTGVNLKMAVSRLTGWAADCGVKEDRLPQAARSTDMSDYRLFPCLRATADLLMMPKEVLTDASIRREVVPGLPLHRVCQLLERFQPDDCAPDPLPPGLLETLQSESPRSDGSTPSPTSKAEDEYAPPPEASLLADGVIEPLSLELDEESEDELESLAGVPLHPRAAGSGSGGPTTGGGLGSGALEDLRAQRFVLLRELWAAAPR